MMKLYSEKKCWRRTDLDWIRFWWSVDRVSLWTRCKYTTILKQGFPWLQISWSQMESFIHKLDTENEYLHDIAAHVATNTDSLPTPSHTLLGGDVLLSNRRNGHYSSAGHLGCSLFKRWWNDSYRHLSPHYSFSNWIYRHWLDWSTTLYHLAV